MILETTVLYTDDGQKRIVNIEDVEKIKKVKKWTEMPPGHKRQSTKAGNND